MKAWEWSRMEEYKLEMCPHCKETGINLIKFKVVSKVLVVYCRLCEHTYRADIDYVGGVPTLDIYKG